MILTPLQKLPKNVRDLGKLIVANGLKKLPKVQKIAQSGHTAGINEIFQANLSDESSSRLICLRRSESICSRKDDWSIIQFQALSVYQLKEATYLNHFQLNWDISWESSSVIISSLLLCSYFYCSLVA